MSDTDTLKSLSIEFALLLDALREATRLAPVPVGFLRYLGGVGIDLQGVLAQPDELVPALEGIVGAHERVESVLLDASPDAADHLALLEATGDVLDAVHRLASLSLLPGAALRAGDLPRLVIDHFVLLYLRTHRRMLYHTLLLTGLASAGQPEQGVPERLHLERLAQWFDDPEAVLRAAHGWGTPDFDSDRLLQSVSVVLGGLGFLVHELLTTREARSALGESVADDAADFSTRELQLPLVSERLAGVDTRLGLTLMGLLPGAAGDDGGLALVPFGNAATALDRTLDDGTRLHFRTNAEASVPYGLVARPERFEASGIGDAVAPAVVDVSLDIVREASPGRSTRVFGSDRLGSFDVSAIGARLGLRHDSEGHSDAFIGFPLHGRIALQPPDDGLLGSLLPPDGLSAPLSLEPGWSLREGLYLDAAGSLELDLPINRTVVEGLRVDSATLAIGVRDERVPLSISITASAALGPFLATVERMGVEFSLSFRNEPGQAPAAFDYRVKPPEGVALSLGSGTFSGGGFLHHDAEKGEYAGLLQLKVDRFMLTGVALLSTRRADGAPGFSLVVLINGEFPAVQLGLGFTLGAVGGLLGVNRTARIDALQNGVREGTIDSVLFPERALERAPAIIANLQRFFPEAHGSHLFGPMARIGWGPVPIVLAEIGIALEFPDPLRLLLFGQVHVGLPSLARPVLDLHMDLFGAIDLDAGTLAIDAALVDSAITGFRLEGEAALRAKWKGFDPEFAMAVGGFHPRAVPPANFPSLGRVSLDLSPTRRVRIGLESYFALTANSVQCGARVDLAASVGRISAEAFLGFDTLFQFEPFRFQVDVTAGAVVRAFGRTVLSATLDFRLSGPRPWHAVGTIRYRVVIRRTEHLDITFGDEPDRRPVVIENPRERLLEELGRASAWSGQHQPFGGTAVALRDPSGESDGELLLHPQGRLAVTQTVMPLDRAIEKYGERPIGDPHGFFIAAVRVNGRQVQFDVTRERFALSQFFELTEHQRLSLPAYQSFGAGMRMRAEGKSAGDRVSVQPQYEEVVLDRLRGERRRTPERTSLPAGVLARQHERGALARVVRGSASGSVFPNRGRRIRLRAAE